MKTVPSVMLKSKVKNEQQPVSLAARLAARAATSATGAKLKPDFQR